ncbi:MAG: nitroreductase family protein, partial [Lentimicrobiaceae bacterium]|nr:nitroreductase family protein [Lentimicrobiaceae bacterium]
PKPATQQPQVRPVPATAPQQARPATGTQQQTRPATGTQQQTRPAAERVTADRAAADAARTTGAEGDADRTEKEHFRLEEPERGGGRPYRELFNEDDMASPPYFSERDIEPRLLSTLLWEVSAVKKEVKEDGAVQDFRGVDVYVVTRDYVALYRRESITLEIIAKGNDELSRIILGKNNMFAEKAPVILIYVASAKKQAKIPVGKKDFYTAMDCGIASQAAYIFCASENMATTTIEVDPIAVGKILGLKNDKVLLAQPIGFR